MSETEGPVHVSLDRKIGAAFIPIGGVPWEKWRLLGELYEDSVRTGACLNNGSPEASPHIIAGGWNLIAPLPAFTSLLSRVREIAEP